MARFMCMAVVGIVAAVSLMQCAAAQTVHVVGGDMGWTVPQNGAAAYSTWAAGKRFMVGDILEFNFATNEHDVLQVPKASFDACSNDNPIGSTITVGPANVTLTSAGENYFICTFGQHCQFGQKLAITVSGSSDSPLPAPSPTSTPTTPNSPCPTSGPTGSTPSGSAPDPNGNTNSSSSAVLASLLLSMLAIVMGLIA